MFWFSPKAPPKTRETPGPPDGPQVFSSSIDRLTYAIGDIHGRNDLFLKMLLDIRNDAEAVGEKPRIVLLGDYIDRGPNSAEVLTSILRLQTQTWCDTAVLVGNHEFALIKFCLDSSCGWLWLEHGGTATLASYGILVGADKSDFSQWPELQQKVIRSIPKSHMKLMCEAKIKFIAGDYLFVHGGVNPDLPLDLQDAETLLWIREAFLSSPKSCDYVVVHGHSAKVVASNLEWRIGVDTGAYATGILTAVKLLGTTREIIQVSTR
ncbi:Bis(5'-nucleosyl)-tetraphosphatase, symmetrical (plasmid) [Asticcacaulis sp. MM231]|uniref:metallophosphoesterase family protein n=1 Tax=Asticcacaulis sp. MM231 TaxID=3157666 RepID=UPI0032D567B2